MLTIKKSYSYLTIPVLFSIILNLNAEFGCIDNSLHCACEPDYKTFKYVYCTCPCSKYPSIDKRGMCLKCRHYHAPARDRVVQYDPATDMVCIAP